MEASAYLLEQKKKRFELLLIILLNKACLHLKHISEKLTVQCLCSLVSFEFVFKIKEKNVSVLLANLVFTDNQIN